VNAFKEKARTESIRALPRASSGSTACTVFPGREPSFAHEIPPAQPKPLIDAHGAELTVGVVAAARDQASHLPVRQAAGSDPCVLAAPSQAVKLLQGLAPNGSNRGSKQIRAAIRNPASPA